MKRLKVAFKADFFYSITELAKEVGKSTQTLRKLEENGIIPPANYRYSKGDWAREGNRMYSKTLVKELVPLIKQITRGKKVSDELKLKIQKAFKNEKAHFEKEED